LKETSAGDYARLRFVNSDASAEYWDVAAGGTDSERMNFFTRGTNVVSLFPDGIGDNLIETSANGARLTQAGVWTNGSSRSFKTDFESVDKRSILERVAAMPLDSWRYKSEPPTMRHIGPVAEDFYDAFGLGDSDKSIGTLDADGVALAAIQGLYELVKEQQAEIVQLRAEMKRVVEIAN
jgi:hypothetical protein